MIPATGVLNWNRQDMQESIQWALVTVQPQGATFGASPPEWYGYPQSYDFLHVSQLVGTITKPLTSWGTNYGITLSTKNFKL